MRSKKMMKYVQKFAHMRHVPAGAGPPDIIHDHVADRLRAAGARVQIFRKPARHGFGHVFVLGDRQYFRFGQTAEGDAILKTDHDEDSLQETRSFGNLFHRPGGSLICLKLPPALLRRLAQIA